MRSDSDIEPPIHRDGIAGLGVIGDRRTAAVIDRNGNVSWYCPGRFDNPSLFASLLDPNGGFWRVDLTAAQPKGRNYLGPSGVLRTTLAVGEREWTITDFMPTTTAEGLLCRRFSVAPADVRMVICPKPNYGRDRVYLTHESGAIVINSRWRIYASHPLKINGDLISLSLLKGDEGWAVLANTAQQNLRSATIDAWLTATLTNWNRISSTDDYDGSYKNQVSASLRALRLLHHEQSGGIVAAVTSSLPEILAGTANWDYRYVWLRDAGMIVSALVRAGGGPDEGERYLDFICSSRGNSSKYPLAVLTNLDKKRAPDERQLAFCGYGRSQPVRVGNGANDQLQLDGFANVLLAAKLIYQRRTDRPHWDTIAAIADFLEAHWMDADNGIWEEPLTRQYTTGKVITACGLDSIAEFSTELSQVQRWRAAVRAIREFVAANCLTPSGAYAVFPGSHDVDLSAALFPIWANTSADAPEMQATIRELEARHSWRGLLFWRHLECSDASNEGAFLAGTFWIAQYWIMRGKLDRAQTILDAALGYANDLGLFSEEVDPRISQMLGNFPQAFVHAAFLGAAVDLRTAETTQASAVT